jgi:hypothetical protein
VSNPVIYSMKRGGEVVATVVTLPNGKCVVSWPTSTIVYDSEAAARAVHITHMGGRGERTVFEHLMSSAPFNRGWENAIQDACEGCPDAAGPRAPHYIEEAHREDYEAGYLACAKAMYGEDYKPDESMTRELDQQVAAAMGWDYAHGADARGFLWKTVAFSTDPVLIPEMLAWLRPIALPTDRLILTDTKEAYCAGFEGENGEIETWSGFCETPMEALSRLVVAVGEGRKAES